MIPLAHWLVEKTQEGQPPVFASPAATEESVQACLEDEPQDESKTVSSEQEAQLKELQQALREAEERLAQMARDHARKEQELADRLGDALSNRLGAEVAASFHALAQQVEEALAEALVPFLEVAVRDRAVKSLSDLVRQEVRSRDSAVLEIRAPEALHAPLAAALGETAVAITLSESTTVDVVFTGERLRFQDLASAWSAAITKDKT